MGFGAGLTPFLSVILMPCVFKCLDVSSKSFSITDWTGMASTTSWHCYDDVVEGEGKKNTQVGGNGIRFLS